MLYHDDYRNYLRCPTPEPVLEFGHFCVALKATGIEFFLRYGKAICTKKYPNLGPIEAVAIKDGLKILKNQARWAIVWNCAWYIGLDLWTATTIMNAARYPCSSLKDRALDYREKLLNVLSLEETQHGKRVTGSKISP